MNLFSMNVAQLLVLVAFVLGTSATSQAALIFSISNTTIDAGGSGTIDIILMNDFNPSIDPSTGIEINPPGPVSMTFVEFNAIITPLAGAGDLVFSAADPLVNPDYSYQTDSNYIFASDGSPAYSPGASTTLSYVGEDETFSTNTISLNNGQSRLVARIEVNHILGSGQSAGSFPDTTFTVGLTEGLTGVFDFNSLDSDEKSFSIATGGGLVSVIAVPEPASLLALGAMCIGYIGRNHRRRKFLKQA